MLMLLFYARWQFPTLRLKHKNLKKNHQIEMSICIKYKTRVIPTGCIHSRSMSVIIHNWTQSAQLEFHRVWGSAFWRMPLWARALPRWHYFSWNGTKNFCKVRRSWTWKIFFPSRLFMSPQWQIKPTLFTNYIFLAQLSIGKHLLRTNSGYKSVIKCFKCRIPEETPTTAGLIPSSLESIRSSPALLTRNTNSIVETLSCHFKQEPGQIT